jgi:hypothetical protein
MAILENLNQTKIKIKIYIMVLNIKPLSDRVLIEPVAAAKLKLLRNYFQIQPKKTTKRNCSWKW